MNIGNIPGYYYDEEKKRYFKIQANHQVPRDAKYSKGSVQQDKREAKKRKTDDRRQKLARKQTVGRPRIFASYLAADISLHREHGNREPARSLSDRDAAVVKSLRASRHRVNLVIPSRPPPEIVRLETCRSSQEGILATRLGNTQMLHSLPSGALHKDTSPLRLFDDLSGPYAAFGSPVTSMSVAETGDDIILFASTERKGSPGNVFAGRIIPGCQHAHHSDTPCSSSLASSNYATLGTTTTTSLWQTSINPAKDSVAVAGTLGVWSLDLACTLRDRLSITRRDYAEPEDDETRALDWLDAHTIAAGSEQIYLWDQRSGGASQRFRCKGRVTGIQNPDRGVLRRDDATGQTLLASTNRYINLFDVRYVSKSKPVLSWRHEHEGAQISLTSSGQGLFAAVDRDYHVHVYSTRTGGEVARLERTEGGKGRRPVSNLRWYEDECGGLGLRALQDGDVVEWQWSGED